LTASRSTAFCLPRQLTLSRPWGAIRQFPIVTSSLCVSFRFHHCPCMHTCITMVPTRPRTHLLLCCSPEPLSRVLHASNSSTPFLLNSLRHLVTISRPIGNSMHLPPIKINLFQWLLILELSYPTSFFCPFPHLPYHLSHLSNFTNFWQHVFYPVRACY
jgi:hypothetical protein